MMFLSANNILLQDFSLFTQSFSSNRGLGFLLQQLNTLIGHDILSFLLKKFPQTQFWTSRKTLLLASNIQNFIFNASLNKSSELNQSKCSFLL